MLVLYSRARNRTYSFSVIAPASQQTKTTQGVLCPWWFPCACRRQSSLLSAILGELSQEGGVVKVRGELTYTSQQPWILPGTLRSNILFGKALNRQKYDRVLRACALKRVRTSPPVRVEACCVRGLNFSPAF